MCSILPRFLALVGTALLASACVSGSSGTGNPTPLPQYAAIGPSSLDADIAQPSDQVLSLAASEGATLPVSGSQIAVPTASETASTVETQVVATPVPNSVPTPATRKPSVQTTEPQAVAVAALPTNAGKPANAPVATEPSAVAAPAPPAPQTEPAKKQSFLSRLFGGNRKNNRLVATDGETATRTASLTGAAKQQNPGGRRPATPLPGVKSNAEIFGIEETNPITGKPTQVAALGSLGRLSPNGLRLQHDKVQVACLKPDILHLLAIIERHYGKKPIITSGYRSPKRNRRAGGAKNSMHIFCRAVDIQIEGVSKWDLAKYLRTIPGRGGVGTYCRTRSVHIDTGKVRDWHYPCRRSSKRRKKKA